MSTVAKVVLYVAFMVLMYANEYDIPVMLYVKRTRYLANWKVAAYMQRQAIDAYTSYVEEAEYTRG